MLRACRPTMQQAPAAHGEGGRRVGTMTRCLPFFLGLLLSTGAIAQPAGPPVPTANAEAKTKQAHAQLTRKLKEAIREGFKHHDAEMHWYVCRELKRLAGCAAALT